MQTTNMIIQKRVSYRHLLTVAATALLLGLSAPAKAQYDPGYTHYMFNEILVNPAYAGAKDALSIVGLARDQWVGFSGAPHTASLTAHTPLAQDQIGLGAGLNFETIGVHQWALGFVDFAYRIHFPKGIWALGLQGSFGYQESRYGDLKNLDSDPSIDPLLQYSPANFLVNAGVGTYYYTNNFYAGFSIPRILNNDYITGESKRFDVRDWTYYLQSGYVFYLSDDFEVMPSGMLKLTAGVRPQVNISALALLYSTLWLGADYRTDNSLAMLAGVEFLEKFRLTYSYDVSLSKTTRQDLDGSHELSLSYTFDIIHKHVVSPRLF